MPRRNKTPQHDYFTKSPRNMNKQRFASERSALEFAKKRMLENPELTLFVYRDLDGGWYLTSKKLI